jgi:hypothetical protein
MLDDATMAGVSAKQVQQLDAALKRAKRNQAAKKRLGPLSDLEELKGYLEYFKRRVSCASNYDWSRWTWRKAKQNGRVVWSLVVPAKDARDRPLVLGVNRRSEREFYPSDLRGRSNWDDC